MNWWIFVIFAIIIAVQLANWNQISKMDDRLDCLSDRWFNDNIHRQNEIDDLRLKIREMERVFTVMSSTEGVKTQPRAAKLPTSSSRPAGSPPPPPPPVRKAHTTSSSRPRSSPTSSSVADTSWSVSDSGSSPSSCSSDGGGGGGGDC